MTAVAFDSLWPAARTMLNEMFGETVIISGAEGSASGVTASWFVSKLDNAIERSGTRITAPLKRQWTVAKSAYVLGSRTTPARGDRLIDGDGTEWELLPEEKQEAWQDMGADWLLLTKKAA